MNRLPCQQAARKRIGLAGAPAPGGSPPNGFARAALLVVLALTFTGGLTFATVELPYLLREWMVKVRPQLQ